MNRERTNSLSSPECRLWEILLADALDGLLRPGDETLFSEHMAHCPKCAALFEEARKGREWLEFLSPEPEVPSGLLDKILASTGPGHAADQKLVAGAGIAAMPPVPFWQRSGPLALLRRYAEPRLMMTAAMAFFSIALSLNLAGVSLSHLRLASLRPTAVRSFMERRLSMASTPVIRYYDHLRVVSEVQARVRELRQGIQSEEQSREQSPEQEQQKLKETAPASPGESQRNLPPGENELNGSTALISQTPAQYNSTDPFKKIQRLQDRSTPWGGSAGAVRERSAVWTA
jgi:hypothetical protein